MPSDFTDSGQFSLHLKTEASDGMILYMADDSQLDFVALYMLENKLVYAYNCGSGVARIVSADDYNDGGWHSVEFSRDGSHGRLVVDGVSAEGEAEGSTSSINVLPPFYVGGLSKKAATVAATNLEDVTNSIDGCLSDLRLNGQSFEAPEEHFVQPCSAKMETGMFFLAEGGYNRLYDNFKVGLDLDIKFDFKPRTLSGVLLSISSPKGDYLVIQMVNGELIFSVDNGAGAINSTYVPTARNELCNGEWHSIDAKKAKNVVTLRVDEVFTYPGMGTAGVSSTDTNDPLYIGGIPPNDRHPGIRTSQQYVGCIRNLQLGRTAAVENLNRGQVIGGVLAGGCPSG